MKRILLSLMLMCSFSALRAGNLEAEFRQINSSRVASLVKALGCGFAGWFTGWHAWHLGGQLWDAVPSTLDGKDNAKRTFKLGTLTGANAYMTYLFLKWGWGYTKHALDIK